MPTTSNSVLLARSRTRPAWDPRFLLAERTQKALERLALADPTNAGRQRDLWVSYWRMATIERETQSRRRYDVVAEGI